MTSSKWDRRPFKLPRRKNLALTSWCRISWYLDKVGPLFRFHFVWTDGRPHLWMKIGPLDTAFHRYDSPARPWTDS